MDATAPTQAEVGRAPELPGLTIVTLLHAGERSTTYLARQESLHRDVVVKLVHAHLEDRGAWAAFRREARAASSLHPAIAAVYTAGRMADGRPFLVMENLPNGSLEDRLASGERMPPEAVRDLGVALSGALLAARRQGIVHGDVDASRLLFTDRGSPKLTGFGLSRLGLAGDAAALEHDGPSRDVAALGSTLLRALHGATRSPRPHSLLSTRLAHILHDCLEPDPARRPGLETVHAELAALQDYSLSDVAPATGVASEPSWRVIKQSTAVELAVVHSTPASPPRPARWWTVGLLALVAAGVVGIASYFVVHDVLDERTTTRSAEPVTTTGAPTSAPPTTAVPTTAEPSTAVPTAAPTTAAPATPAAPPTTSAPVVPIDSAATAPDEFVRRYYEIVNAEDYQQGWSLLSSEFRAARAQTYDGYVRYWQRHDVDVGEVTVVSAGGSLARVRVAMQYIAGDQRVSEVDELTVRAVAGVGWEIVDQSVVR